MNIFKKIFYFYYDWFFWLSSTWKKLWILIIVKSSIILIVLNIYFPNYLWQFKTQEEKIEAVKNSLIYIK